MKDMVISPIKLNIISLSFIKFICLPWLTIISDNNYHYKIKKLTHCLISIIIINIITLFEKE